MRVAAPTRSATGGSAARSGSGERSSVGSFREPGRRPVSPWLHFDVERAAGVVEVDVVETRSGDGRRFDLHAGLVQRRQDARDDTGGRTGSGPDDPTLVADVVEPVEVRKAFCSNGCGRLVDNLNDDTVAVEPALELVGGALYDEATVVDDREPVGEMVRLVEVVRREQDRQLFDRSQAGDLLPHLRAGLGVQAGRGLVEEEYGWPGDQAHGDVELAQH